MMTPGTTPVPCPDDLGPGSLVSSSSETDSEADTAAGPAACSEAYTMPLRRPGPRYEETLYFAGPLEVHWEVHACHLELLAYHADMILC